MDVQIASDRYLMLDAILVSTVVVVVLSLLAARATRDMNRRGASGWVFGLLVATVPPIGLVAWAVGSTLLRRSDGVPASVNEQNHVPTN